jgi:hypothetical protein
MSSIGSPLDTSLLQAAQAQQSASKSRDKEKAQSDTGRRFQDVVELRVAGVESSDAIRKLPSNDSEQAEEEHHANPHTVEKHPPREGEPTIDVTA